MKKLAKFGCYVTRWKDGKVFESWTEHVAFRADPAL